MARSILHMLSPSKHVSPFDVNMALDAGFDLIVPYQAVLPGEVGSLVQDAIFSRAPQDGSRTCLFVGGKDAETALDMMAAAKAAFVPPFRLSLFADPSGSFTTAAAMIALVSRRLSDRAGSGIAGRHVAIFGGTGVVAYGAAVLAAGEGARPVLVGHDGADRVARVAAAIGSRFGANVEAADGSTAELRREIIRQAEVVLSAAKAGIQVLSAEDLRHAPKLLLAADVNAVPPAGIAGLEVQANGSPLGDIGQALGIGALAIGNIKYQTELGLFRRILASDQPLAIGLHEAFALASEIAGRG
jgi:methylene-tetrahydromethanopterin dehydrogenase